MRRRTFTTWPPHHAKSPPHMNKIKLPNGDECHCLNKHEASLLYKDLFEDRSYFQFGILIGAGATIVDVGANIGLFALMASREAERVTVYSLEPLPPIYEVLKANYEMHEIRGTALPYGVGRKNERVNFTFYSDNTALSGRFADAEQERELILRILQNRFPQVPHSYLEGMAEQGLAKQTYECQIRTLSEILREIDVDHINLLKVDVEKAELDVLEGIDAADWQRIDQTVAEVHNIDDRLQFVCELLRTQGFQVQYSQGDAFAQTGLYDVFASRLRTS
jgi:FkbM family methyltransferase